MIGNHSYCKCCLQFELQFFYQISCWGLWFYCISSFPILYARGFGGTCLPDRMNTQTILICNSSPLRAGLGQRRCWNNSRRSLQLDALNFLPPPFPHGHLQIADFVWGSITDVSTAIAVLSQRYPAEWGTKIVASGEATLWAYAHTRIHRHLHTCIYVPTPRLTTQCLRRFIPLCGGQGLHGGASGLWLAPGCLPTMEQLTSAFPPLLQIYPVSMLCCVVVCAYVAEVLFFFPPVQSCLPHVVLYLCCICLDGDYFTCISLHMTNKDSL